MACFYDEPNKILVHIVNYENRKHIKKKKQVFILFGNFCEILWG